MIPFSLMVVLDDLWFLPRMVMMLDHHCFLFESYCFQKNSQEDYDNTALCQFGLLE